MNLTVNILQTDFTSESALSVAIGGITINGDSNLALSSTHTVVVTDGESVDISVESTGFYTYTNTVKTYDEDLNLFLVLVPVVTDILSADYNRPYPSLFTVQDPCSFKVDVYNASSHTGERTWYMNNEVLSQTSTNFTLDLCAVGEYQIKQRVRSYRFVDGTPCPSRALVWDNQFATTLTGNTVAETLVDIQTYLDADTTTNITVVEHRPDFSFNFSVPENQASYTCCYAQYEEVTITPSFTLPGVDDYTLTWEVTNPLGLEVELDQASFPLQGFAPDTAATSFTFSTLGDYKIKATILDVRCGTEFVWEETLQGCDFLVFELTACQEYVLENRSLSIPVQFTMEEYDGDAVAENVTLPPNTKTTVSLPKVGMYILTVAYELEGEQISRTYQVAEYCALEDCISSFILNVLCGDGRECECDYTLSTELDSMRAIALSQTYFMHLHEIFSINNFYTALQDADIKNITDAQQILEYLSKMCNRISCTSDGCGGCTEPITINRTEAGHQDCGCGCNGTGGCK